MPWLNYHHLYYFWMIVREGGVLRASRKLRLAQPTVSEQLRTLEQALGEKLFDRVGNRLVLTEVGHVVHRYASEIFSLGTELQDALQGRPAARSPRFLVGVTDAVPKLVAYRLLEPALRVPEPPQIICYEDRPDRLLADLAVRAIDLVLSDVPPEPGSGVRAYGHVLGESGVSFFATRRVAASLRRGFPRSLDGAPMLLPTPNTTMRRSLSQWFDDIGVRPSVVGEFQDSALLAEFGEQNVGVFPASSVVENDMRSHHGMEVVGRVPTVRERFYAVSAEREPSHPAAILLTRAARSELFRAVAGRRRPR
jgi:LysR family transcriptional activator of nhaA